jgi:ATP-dependent helicase Lhr and Lhr-like helicase
MNHGPVHGPRSTGLTSAHWFDKSRVSRGPSVIRWWTWAGLRANTTLIATLSDVADSTQRVEEFFIRLRSDMTPKMWKAALADAETRLRLPAVDDKAIDGLKFSAALPRHLAEATLAQRLADLNGARLVLAEPQRLGVS